MSTKKLTMKQLQRELDLLKQLYDKLSLRIPKPVTQGITPFLFPEPYPRRHYEPWDNDEEKSLTTAFKYFLTTRATIHQRTRNSIAAHIRGMGLVDKDWNGEK